MLRRINDVISEKLHFHFLGGYSKLDRVKTMGTCEIINAIWWNIKINPQKLVDICGYELPTNFQNFTQKDLNEVKIYQKVLGGLLFWNTLNTCYTTNRSLMTWSGKNILIFKWLTSLWQWLWHIAAQTMTTAHLSDQRSVSERRSDIGEPIKVAIFTYFWIQQ